MLHGITGKTDQDGKDQLPVLVADVLAADPGDRFDIILTNPPFGKKSSTTVVAKDGKVSKEKDIVERDDFWATTSNKQHNFVQHVKTLLKQNGRTAVVVPDNVYLYAFFKMFKSVNRLWNTKAANYFESVRIGICGGQQKNDIKSCF
jgi:type I restriction-modification system DNA methylase subunit